MHVVHIITGLGSGGAERMLTRIVTEARAQGTVQSVISLMDEGVYGAALRETGVTVTSLGMRRGRGEIRMIFRLARQLRRQRPDLVMTWMYHADLLGLAGAALAGIPLRHVVWNLRCSAMDFTKTGRSTHWVVRLLTWLSSWPGAVVVNSETGRRDHQTLGYRPRRWVYLPNGLDVTRWRFDPDKRARLRSELGFAPDLPVIGMVARVDPQKDHDTLLAAMAQLPAPSHLLLIGSGTDTLDLPPSLTGRVTALGDRRDVPDLLSALDLHVLSSAYGEGFPNVVAEAMACERPCLVTDVGDAANLVEGCGLAVPARDPTALAAGIKSLMAESPADRRERGRRGRRKIERVFALDKVLAQYLALWQAQARPPR